VAAKGRGTWRSGDPGHPEGQLSLVRSPGAGRDLARWQVECACGWLGPVRDGSQDPGEPAIGGDAPRVLRRRLRREWAAHVGASATAQVRRAADEVARAQERLEAAVRQARASGASWAQIGDAAGIAKQSAHERWAGGERSLSA
jgi:hypothetical protein